MQKMGFYLQGQHHNSCVCLLCSYNEIMTTSIIFSKLLIFGDQHSLTVHVYKLECLVKRLLCCIQGEGHSEDSGLQ